MAELAAGQMKEAVNPDFRMLRVVLIDSYSPGGEVILKVSDGAILTGENGVGKTSLIRLIPVFFGELPRRITFGTLSFVEFYLARSTSYIIFEYERRGVVCQSVLYAGGGDETYSYRFIRTAYELGQFAEADGKTLIPGPALTTHLKKLGVTHSRALTHDEYRAIIQGRAHTGRDAATNRAYVADYAFTGSGNRLDHLDRIVSGMFRRQAEFRDFLRMVVSYISEKADPIAISGDRSKISIWPKHYAAYQSVMQHAPLMEDIGLLDARLAANEHEFGVLHAKLLVLIDHFTDQEKLLKLNLADANAELLDATAKHGETLEGIRGKETTARLEAEESERRVLALDKADRDYASQEIRVKAILVASLDTLKAQRGEAVERKSILLGKKGEIDQSYERLKLDVGQAHAEKEVKAARRIQEINVEFAPQFAELRRREEEEESTLLASWAARENEASDIIGTAREEAAALEQAAARPSPDEAVVKAWEEKRRALELTRKSLAEPEEDRRKAKSRKTTAQDAFDRQDRVVQALGQRIDKQQTAIARLIGHANPAAGSLLAFLRESCPGWSMDIAKVIQEDLLTRTDLEPALVAVGPRALYGVSLDLSRIEGSLVADEQRLQQELTVARTTLTDAESQLEREKALLAKCLASLETAKEDFGKAESVLVHVHNAVATLDMEEKSSHAAVEGSRQANRATAVARAHEARTREKEARTKLATLQSERKDAIRSLKEAFDQKRKAVEKTQAEAAEMVDSQLRVDRASKEDRIQELDRERQAALAKEGVDLKALDEIEKKIGAAGKSIEEAGEWSEKVAQWQLWLRQDWSRRASIVEDAKKSRVREEKQRKAGNELETNWNRLRTEMEASIGRINAGIGLAHETSSNAGSLLARRGIEDFPVDVETRSMLYDMAWTLDGLTAQANKLAVERRIVASDLGVRVNEIKRAFRTGQGAPTEDYFETTAGEVDPDNNKPRAWVEPLRQWFASRHEEYLRPLLLEARTFGQMIFRFQDEVGQFDRKIRSFNIRMQNALDQTVVFERISRVSITFTSTIAEKAYWKPINDFVRDHESWIRGISRDLPPPAFANDMERLMEHWDVREGIRADRLGLIDVRGEVTENGKAKVFRDSATLAELSSNGLSYLILIIIFVAFVRMIRGDANVRVTYAVDELGDLDKRNIGILVDMLRKNGIDLVSACPDADLDVLMHFPHRYRIDRNEYGPELVEVDVDTGGLAYV